MIDSADLEVDVFPPRPIGGQHAGSYPSSIRVKHIPTGLVAICGFERSQHKNKMIAISMIEYGLVSLGLDCYIMNDKGIE